MLVLLHVCWMCKEANFLLVNMFDILTLHSDNMSVLCVQLVLLIQVVKKYKIKKLKNKLVVP